MRKSKTTIYHLLIAKIELHSCNHAFKMYLLCLLNWFHLLRDHRVLLFDLLLLVYRVYLFFYLFMHELWLLNWFLSTNYLCAAVFKKYRVFSQRQNVMPTSNQEIKMKIKTIFFPTLNSSIARKMRKTSVTWRSRISGRSDRSISPVASINTKWTAWATFTRHTWNVNLIFRLKYCVNLFTVRRLDFSIISY